MELGKREGGGGDWEEWSEGKLRSPSTCVPSTWCSSGEGENDLFLLSLPQYVPLSGDHRLVAMTSETSLCVSEAVRDEVAGCDIPSFRS